MSLDEKNKQVFMDGLRRFQQHGIPVYVDDIPVDECCLEEILHVSEDSSFYMMEYHDPSDSGKCPGIRFNKVHRLSN